MGLEELKADRFMDEVDKISDEKPNTDEPEERRVPLKFKPEEEFKDPAPVQIDKATPIEDSEIPQKSVELQNVWNFWKGLDAEGEKFYGQ